MREVRMGMKLLARLAGERDIVAPPSHSTQSILGMIVLRAACRSRDRTRQHWCTLVNLGDNRSQLHQLTTPYSDGSRYWLGIRRSCTSISASITDSRGQRVLQTA